MTGLLTIISVASRTVHNNTSHQTQSISKLVKSFGKYIALRSQGVIPAKVSAVLLAGLFRQWECLAKSIRLELQQEKNGNIWQECES